MKRLSFPSCNFQANAFQTDVGPAFQFINVTDNTAVATISMFVTVATSAQIFLSTNIQIQVLVTSNNVKPPIISATLIVPGAGVPALTEIVFTTQNITLEAT